MGKRKAWNSTLPAPDRPITRRAYIKAVNRERKKRREAAGEVYGPYHKSMADHPCAVLRIGECYGDVAGHHIKSVGAGGKDAANEVPLCWWHHRELHTIGMDAFEWKHGISLDAEAAYLWKRWADVVEVGDP